jgi:structural maintenance of chromosome 4
VQLCEHSTDLIPKLEEIIPKLQKLLLDEEKVLEEIKDNQLRSCKEEFKKIERQDVKYRKDLKHMKQKIKKLDDKLEKVMKIIYEVSE